MPVLRLGLDKVLYLAMEEEEGDQNAQHPVGMGVVTKWVGTKRFSGRVSCEGNVEYSTAVLKKGKLTGQRPGRRRGTTAGGKGEGLA